MGHERIAFIATGCEQYSGPEIFQESQMGVPILDLLIEERPDLVIFTDLCVKAIDETRDLCFGDTVFVSALGTSGTWWVIPPDWILQSSKPVDDERLGGKQDHGDFDDHEIFRFREDAK